MLIGLHPMSIWPFKTHFPTASRLVYGCMRLGGEWNSSPLDKEDVNHAQTAVEAAVDAGITVFDHADIYARGKAEAAFGKVLKNDPTLRREIIIQSKCGIRFADSDGPKRYDLSADWVRASVDGILERLGIEQLDILLLHRPDPLMEAEPLARCLDDMIAIGKLRHVGVSNMSSGQINIIQSALYAPVVVNQLQMSLTHHNWVTDGLLSNSASYSGSGFSAGTIEYCVEQGIQLQAWAPLSGGLLAEGHADSQYQPTRQLLKGLADQYGCSTMTIELAWLMRHPANIQPVIGTTRSERIRECVGAEHIELSREHWYALLESIRGVEIP